MKPQSQSLTKLISSDVIYEFTLSGEELSNNRRSFAVAVVKLASMNPNELWQTRHLDRA